MALELLKYTAPVFVYYDTVNDWLFTDWHGDLTLAQVQQGCLTVANCFLQYPKPRILNNNSEVTSMSADVPAWLTKNFFSSLRLAGVEYLAWVYGPTPLLQRYAEEAIGPEGATLTTLFSNLADAYDWLQRTHSLAPAAAHYHALQRIEFTERITTLSAELKHHQQVAGLIF